MIEKVINYKVRLTTYTKTELQFYLKIIFTKNISNKETKKSNQSISRKSYIKNKRYHGDNQSRNKSSVEIP